VFLAVMPIIIVSGTRGWKLVKEMWWLP